MPFLFFHYFLCYFVACCREPVTFVKELIYRSLERQNLDKVYRQIQELRKRLRTREQKAVRYYCS